MKQTIPIENLHLHSPFHWDNNASVWKMCFVHDSSDSLLTSAFNPRYSSVDIKSLTILTFNVLFDRKIRESYDFPTEHAQERFEHAFRDIENLRPDIICLQEVTQTFLSMLARQDWIRRNYYMSFLDDSICIHPYGQVTLSRFPIHRLHTYRFGATSIKRCVLTEFLINGKHVLLANVHLPAGRGINSDLDTKQRCGQLKRIFTLVNARGSDRFIAGDFNFGDDSAENECIDKAFEDAWKQVRINHPGYTTNTEKNFLTRELCPGMPPVRIDRILYSSSTWKAKESKLVLQDPFKVHSDPKHSALYPSDHFGVFTIFELG